MAELPTFEDIKTIPLFEDIEKKVPVHLGIKLPKRGEPSKIGVAPEATFGQKWKEYFFSRGDEGRWTKPDRYEKFRNYTHWPVKTSLQMIGSVINRANKFITEVSAAASPNVLNSFAPPGTKEKALRASHIEGRISFKTSGSRVAIAFIPSG